MQKFTVLWPKCAVMMFFKSPNMIVLAISVPKWDDATRSCAYCTAQSTANTGKNWVFIL